MADQKDHEGELKIPRNDQPQPGTIITPGGLPRSAQDRVTASIVAADPAPEVIKPTPPVAPVAPTQPPIQTLEPTPAAPTQPLLARHEIPQAPLQPNLHETEDGIVWTASEYVAHEKSIQWYFLLIIVALAISLLAFLLTQDYVTVGVILFGALILGIYGARKPQQITYRLDDRGIQIGRKYHFYDEFRSYAIIQDGAFASISLLPLKRFAPMMSVYYSPDDEDLILAVLGSSLPNEVRKPDVIDRLMRTIRF